MHYIVKRIQLCVIKLEFIKLCCYKKELKTLKECERKVISSYLHKIEEYCREINEKIHTKI